MTATKRALLGLAAAGVLAPRLAQAQAANPPGVAPPRTLEELKAETLLRVETQAYPGVGLRIEDARQAMGELDSLQPDAWARVWIKAGDGLMQQAKAAKGEPAKRLYRTAFTTYSMGGFPAPTSPGKRAAYDKALSAYMAYTNLIVPPLEVVRIPFEGKQIIGYFRKPADGAGPFPMVLSTGGLDYLKEQVADEGLWFLPHGFCWFAIDMPGTGQSPVKADVGSERVFSRVLDWAATRPDIDAKRVFVRGVSWGGHWATRVGIVEKDRLIGANNQGGPVAQFYTPEWQMKALGTREYLLDLFGGRSAIYGVKTLDAFLAYGPRMSLLNDGMIDRPSAPMLVMNGAKDTQVPVADQLLLLVHGDAKEAWINPKGGHMGFGDGWTAQRVDTEIVIPWMKRMIVRAAAA